MADDNDPSDLCGVIGTCNSKIKLLAETAELVYFEAAEKRFTKEKACEYLWALTTAIHMLATEADEELEKLDVALLHRHGGAHA